MGVNKKSNVYNLVKKNTRQIHTQSWTIPRNKLKNPTKRRAFSKEKKCENFTCKYEKRENTHTKFSLCCLKKKRRGKKCFNGETEHLFLWKAVFSSGSKHISFAVFRDSNKFIKKFYRFIWVSCKLRQRSTVLTFYLYLY